MSKKLEYPLLVVDAGNSWVKFASVSRPCAKPKLVGAVPTARLTLAAARRHRAKTKSVCVASVVPAASRILKRAFPGASFIGARTRAGFASETDRRTIGSDRLANVAAAHARFGRNVLVASFGTAATFDVIDARGVHLGGAIAPGWKSFAALASDNAAQLPRVDARAPLRMIGRRTREALRAGINGGYAALVAQLVRELKKEAKTPDARLVFTGGDAPIVARLARLTSISSPLLTLEGIALLAETTAREGSK